jgi:hypothetical protein
MTLFFTDYNNQVPQIAYEKNKIDSIGSMAPSAAEIHPMVI